MSSKIRAVALGLKDTSSKIKAVAFDLDNTLIDFMKFKHETADAAAEAMVRAGLKAEPHDVAEQIFAVYEKHGIEYQKTFSVLLQEEYNIRDPNEFEKIQQAGIAAYLKRKFEVLEPYPDVVPTLKKLREKGLMLFIVTDAPRNKAWQRLTICGLADKFDFVITFDDTKVQKPHHLPFKTLLAKTGLKPEEILFVGDNPDKDVAGAKKAGMKTVLARYGCWNTASKVRADFEIQSFGELLVLADGAITGRLLSANV